MAHCEFEHNAFCSRLSEEDRQALCRHCQIFKFSKKMDPKERCPQVSAQLMYPGDKCCTLILQGIIYTSSNRGEDISRVYILSQPGDLMHPETIFNGHDPLAAHCSWHYLSDGAYAVISSRILKELFLRSPSFAAVLFQCLTDMRIRQNNFLLETHLQDAYSALMYVLLLCRECGVKPLTHQDLARITNLNRTTVTKTMKRILANENLNISLSEHLRTSYENECGPL